MDPVTKFGWYVKLNHVFPEKRDQNIKPSIWQLLPFMPFALRYCWFYWKKYREGKLPFIDGFNPLEVEQIYGVPAGGIGGGSISRGFKGEFCRFHMIPGIYHHNIVFANQFIVSIRKRGCAQYQQVLSPYIPSSSTFSGLSSWNWGFCGEFAEYRALYPQSWTTYELPGQNVTLICHQISPVIPKNYKDSCIPSVIFLWTVINKNSEAIDVSITLTFKNGVGCKKIDRNGGCWTESFEKSNKNLSVKGVSLHQVFNDEMSCTYNVAATETDSVNVSHCVEFDPCGTGDKLWSSLLQNGRLDANPSRSEETVPGAELACAVCAQCSVQPGDSNQMEMCLAWDMPSINFRENRQKYLRRYTRWFGFDGNSGPDICQYSLANYQRWENEINNWQSGVLNNRLLPVWYKSALFNELYYISDGGSIWVEMPNSEEIDDVRREYGRFAYLESHEYRMYNTYDVHFYASFALAMLWPQLQLSVQYDFNETVKKELKEEVCYLMDGKISFRKTINTIPHDLGEPESEPWLIINGYEIHDVASWKDLNVKFVLQVYRDYIFTKNLDFLKDMWSSVCIVMEKSLSFDVDGDGLIENSGDADQTFDTWVMHGTSAYCGGLWLSALFASIQMARILGKSEEADRFGQILNKGKISFEEKLWNGTYYKFDCKNRETIMSDQLCGHWYHKACLNGTSIFPHDNVKKCLGTIFAYNVMKNDGGKRGAVNGMKDDGVIDTSTVQSSETWIGVTYALAATMIHEGMWKEGMKTAEGMYRTIYEQIGLGFQTPEAILPEKNYRAPGYMRPLSIWAIQWAIENTSDEIRK